jgi:hypothetical protein
VISSGLYGRLRRTVNERSGNAVNGINVWARHMQGASSLGNTCPTHGDSGAPVFRKQWTDAVAAVGIYCGGFPEVLACDAYFTDIWDAFDGLPGTLKVQ